MDKNEIKKEMNMTYSELTKYLQSKYGLAKYDYFRKETCKSKNPKNARGNEGLIIHHIDEDKAIQLSNPARALKNPFDYQKADRLVYCNYIEHLLLHLKIIEEPRHPLANPKEIPGLGGAINYIIPELNDFYMGKSFSREYYIIAFDLVKENYKDYIEILKKVKTIIENNDTYKKVAPLTFLANGWGLEPYKKIKKAIGLK